MIFGEKAHFGIVNVTLEVIIRKVHFRFILSLLEVSFFYVGLLILKLSFDKLLIKLHNCEARINCRHVEDLGEFCNPLLYY